MGSYPGEYKLHTCRNAMMGASFQASIAALFFNELLDILVSPSKLRTLQVLPLSPQVI